MIDQEDHHAGDEQSDGADEHCGSLFYIGEERDPDQDAENKKERIGGANVPCLQAVVGADQDLTRETALVGEDARRQVDPDAQDGIDRDPCRYKPGNPGSAQDRPSSVFTVSPSEMEGRERARRFSLISRTPSQSMIRLTR